MNSKNITVTEGKLVSGLDKINQSSIEKTVPQAINTVIEQVSIRTGVIVRFFPYIDKAEVKLDSNGKKILCKILHRYGGDLLDFYTPSAYDNDFDDSLQEPYVIPKAEQCVCVLNIHDNDSDEHIILGYYNNEEIVGFNPAKPGNIKLTKLSEDGNEFWIKFGVDGFNYKIPSKSNVQVGNIYDEEGVQDVEYPTSDDIYTIDEVDGLINSYDEKITQFEELVNSYNERITQLEELVEALNTQINNQENNQEDNQEEDDEGV